MTLFLPLFFMTKEKCYFLVDCSYHVSLAFDLEPMLWLLGWLVYFFPLILINDIWKYIHRPFMFFKLGVSNTSTVHVGLHTLWGNDIVLSFCKCFILDTQNGIQCLLSLSFVITCISLRRYLDFCKYLVSYQTYVQF